MKLSFSHRVHSFLTWWCEAYFSPGVYRETANSSQLAPPWTGRLAFIIHDDPWVSQMSQPYFSSHRTCCFRLERIKPNFCLSYLNHEERMCDWGGTGGGDFGRAKDSSQQESTFSKLSLKQSSERTARARRCSLFLENLSLLLENLGLVNLVWC